MPALAQTTQSDTPAAGGQAAPGTGGTTSTETRPAAPAGERNEYSVTVQDRTGTTGAPLAGTDADYGDGWLWIAGIVLLVLVVLALLKFLVGGRRRV